MKIRGLLAGLLLAVALVGCTRSPVAVGAGEVRPPSRPALDEAPPPPPPDTTNRGGGPLGSGN